MHKPEDNKGVDKCSALSECALTQITQQRHDWKYAESLIKKESVQLYERASYSWLEYDRSEHIAARPNLDDSTIDQVTKIGRLYHQSEPSSATPMERFCTMSPANEQMSVIAKVEMAQMRVHVGSLETIKLRSYAARVATGASPKEALDDEIRDEVLESFRKDREKQNIVGKTRVVRVAKRRRGAAKESDEEKEKRQRLD